MVTGGRGLLALMVVPAVLWGSGFLWIKLALNNAALQPEEV